jgi:NADH-quinone oxidoreductase subunit J
VGPCEIRHDPTCKGLPPSIDSPLDMAGLLSFFSAARWVFLGEAAAPRLESALAPALILVLCVLAGIGTLLALPSRREQVFQKIGGVILLAAGLIFAAMLMHFVGEQGRGGMSIYFWLFSIIAIVGAIRVITHPRPVYSALYFVLSVLATAGLFILLWAEFMAAALVIIYAGAILVTYVFVIMMATQSAPKGTAEGSEIGGLTEYDAVSREPLVACAVGFTLMGVLLYVIFDRGAIGTVPTVASANPPGSVQAVGQYLFRSQLVNLELAGLILTIAMVGAIMIARRRIMGGAETTVEPDMVLGPATPVDDNPHSIPVYGTDNPRAKAYPES